MKRSEYVEEASKPSFQETWRRLQDQGYEPTLQLVGPGSEVEVQIRLNQVTMHIETIGELRTFIWAYERGYRDALRSVPQVRY